MALGGGGDDIWKCPGVDWSLLFMLTCPPPRPSFFFLQHCYRKTNCEQSLFLPSVPDESISWNLKQNDKLSMCSCLFTSLQKPKYKFCWLLSVHLKKPSSHEHLQGTQYCNCFQCLLVVGIPYHHMEVTLLKAAWPSWAITYSGQISKSLVHSFCCPCNTLVP